MTLPNFMIIGAARSGSSALYEFLASHPQIFMSEPKETHFFAMRGRRPDFRGPGDEAFFNTQVVTGDSQFQRLFAKSRGALAIGEASVSSLYYPRAVENIHAITPRARLICILRNPADRAYSAYTFLRSRVLEPCDDFHAALEDEDRRVEDNWHHLWHYRRMGFYYRQLKRYFDTFDPQQIHVCLYEDICRDPEWALSDIYGFLDVDACLAPRIEPRTLVSGLPKNIKLQRWLMRARVAKNLGKKILPPRWLRQLQSRLMQFTLKKPEKMAQSVRSELVACYRNDILRLQELIDRDLSTWLVASDATRTPCADEPSAVRLKTPSLVAP